MASVRAKVTSVTQGGGKLIDIEVDDASVSPLKTAIKEKGLEAKALMESGRVALIDFTPKPGNRRQDGSYWPETRWYERGVVADEPEIAQAIPQTDGAGRDEIPRRSGSDESWRIALSVGAKLAVETLPLMPDHQRDPDTQRRIAIWWARIIHDTPHDEAAEADGIPF